MSWEQEAASMEKTFCIAFIIAVCLFLAGCYEVKRTDGLRAACEKILLANYLADEVSARKDLTGDKRKPLVDSYNRAALSVNSFLDAIEEKSVNVVDVPLSAFYTSSASADLDRFISDAVAAMSKPDGAQEDKVGQSSENKEKTKQKPDVDTIGKITDDEKIETEKTERTKTERQGKEAERFEGALLSANAKVRDIMALDGKKSGESYKRFKSLIGGLKMSGLPLQKP